MKAVLITFISLFLLSFGSLCAQDHGEVNNMVKALSYYKGIELTLRCIMEKNSSIAPIAVSQYGLLKMTHGRSVDSLNKELTKILGDDFLKFDKTISQTINCEMDRFFPIGIVEKTPAKEPLKFGGSIFSVIKASTRLAALNSISNKSFITTEIGSSARVPTYAARE